MNKRNNFLSESQLRSACSANECVMAPCVPEVLTNGFENVLRPVRFSVAVRELTWPPRKDEQYCSDQTFVPVQRTAARTIEILPPPTEHHPIM